MRKGRASDLACGGLDLFSKVATGAVADGGASHFDPHFVYSYAPTGSEIDLAGEEAVLRLLGEAE